MLEVYATSRFKRDLKVMIKRGAKVDRLWIVVSKLRNQTPLPESNRDHALVGDYIGFRECQILLDWLLVYRIEEDELILTLARTGAHSDLF